MRCLHHCHRGSTHLDSTLDTYNLIGYDTLHDVPAKYVQWNAKDVQIALQDNNKTLKVFLENN